MFQVIADYYLPNTCIGEELLSQTINESLDQSQSPVNNKTRALALLKKIELSKGYDNYRKNRQMQGIAKPPVIISKTTNQMSRAISRNNTASMVANDFSPSRITIGGIGNRSKELSCFKTMSAVTPFRSMSIF